MDRMKTFLKYALWVIGFFILSEFLINVGLNSTYKDIERRDANSQVSIYQAQATLVNGRIKGIVTNSEPEQLNGKYICIDFYSKRDVFLGKKYIQVENLGENESKPFEAYFKLKDVASYEVSIVDNKEDGEIELIPTDLSKPEVVVATIFTLLMFW